IIEQLAAKLAPFSTGKHALVTADVGEIYFDAGQRHLVILAGVGGERTVHIVSAIRRNNPHVVIDYIFCPSTSQHALRDYLAVQGLAITSDTVACEKRRHYEIMYVAASAASDQALGVPDARL
ncbi:MAG: tRNA (adenine(22)-N(1))-methyltransferase TrmK, partial [Gammaproteobacteria bacterium]|nr:tRNA (adenine(22)-N(1))-methyltransferase TrmK [Gammaproteobacteria bacterium]